MSRAFVFPGQGSQFVGMGKDLAEAFPEARAVFEEINDALGQDLTKIMFEDPDQLLNMTENTQPALMAVSMAVIRVLSAQGGINLAEHCNFMAGHSLGEYSALTASGAFELADTARLLKLRGQVMQEAVPVGKGGMAAILGLSLEDVEGIAAEAETQESLTCQVANDNSNGQVVISGHAGAVARAAELAKEKGAKRAVELPVSAPFHCSLMAPAAQKMAVALSETNIQAPCVPIVSNVTASSTISPDEIRNLLVDQITGRVRWRESVEWMKEQGTDKMVEIGAGKVLSGLARRIDKEIETASVGTPEQIEALITELTS